MAVLVGSARVRVTPDLRGWAEKVRADAKAAMAATGGPVKIPVSFDLDQASLAKARAATMAAFKDTTVKIGYEIDAASVAKVKAQQRVLFKDTTSKVRYAVDSQGIATAVAKQRALTRATDDTTRSTTRLWGIWRLFGGQVSLFAGARQVSVWHLALDGVVETLAVLVPATVTAAAGLAAFGIAGSDAARQVYNRMLNVHTIFDAVDGQLPPLTGNIEKLHDTVRPQVWQLYGDAIDVANEKSGLFNKLAIETGSVIDHMAAKVTVDLTRGTGGLETFIHAGERDLRQLGIAGGEIGHVFLKLIQVTQETHIADFLLQGVVAASKLLGAVADLPTPVLAVVAGLHGVYLWGGLAVTWLARLGTAASALGSKFTTGALAVAAWGEGIAKAEGPTAKLSAAAGFLTKVPVWGWVGLGVVALGGLAYWMSRSKDATDKFTESLDRSVAKATFFTVIPRLTSGIAATSARLAVANQAVAASYAKVRTESSVVLGRFGPLNAAIVQQGSDVQSLTGEQRKLVGQFQGLTTNLGTVAAKYGTSLPGAMALAQIAGVKVADMMSKNKDVVAAALQQIDGLVEGYRNMGQEGGALGSDLNVLTVSESDQLKAVQQLNAAYDQWTKDLAAPRDTFISFARSVVTWGQDAQAAGASMSGLAGDVVKMSRTVSTASLNVQSDFQSSFAAGEQLFDALRTSGAPSAVFTRVVKELTATLLPMTQGNKAAVAEVSALAQEAGGPATTNVKTLRDWVGRSVNPLKAMQRATNQVVIQTSNLSLDARKLSTTLHDDLNAMMAQAALKTSGVSSAMENYSRDLQRNRETTQRGARDRRTLIRDLEKAGLSAAQARAEVDAMNTSIGRIKPVRQVLINVHGHGRWNVTSGFAPGTASRAAAGGGIVPGPAGDGDTHVTRVRPGEGILVPEAVQAVGGPSTVIALNRKFGTGRKSTGMAYAGGGVFGAYSDGAAGLGRWADREYALTVAALERAVADGVIRALTTASVGASGRMASRGLVRAEQMYALSLFGRYGWGPEQLPPLIALWARESGWNPFAVNPRSGAAGIPQALGHGHVFDLGDWRRQIGWGEGYISGRYGSPAGAWAHEQAVGWYAGGTKHAAPGWAWVGERGPELAWMRGGEIVLPAGMSARVGGGIGRGYATGTGLTAEQTSGLSLFDAYVKSGILTIAKVLTEQKQFLHDIARFYSGPALQWRDAVVGRQTRAMEATARKIGSLDARVAAARQYQQSVRSNLSGYAALSGITLDPFASRKGLAAGVEANLQAKLAQLRRFDHVLTALHRAKFSPAIIREVVGMGPDDGYTYARALLAGGSSVIRELNATEAAIGREERSVARTAAVAVYGRGVVDGLKGERAALEQEMRHLGRVLGLEAARWFKVPRSKLPKHFADGGWAAAGSLAVIGEEGEELALFGQAARIIPAGQFEVKMVSPDQFTRPAPAAGATTNYVANITRANQADLERAFHALEVRSAMKLRIGRNS